MTTVPALFLGALALSIVELDEASAGQFAVSRPIVLGPLAGAAFGALWLGTGLGLLYELFSLADPPVGGYLPINHTAAVSAALLYAAGPGGGSAAPAFALGLALGWAHSKLETYLRRSRVVVARRVEARLAASEDPALLRTAGLELLRQASFTFALLSAAIVARLTFARMPLPSWLESGLRFGLGAAPWVGAAALLRALRVA